VCRVGTGEKKAPINCQLFIAFWFQVQRQGLVVQFGVKEQGISNQALGDADLEI
jgi:hypothetical protein